MKRIISVLAISASSLIIAAASHGGTTENSLVTQTNTATATNTTNATDLKARGQQLRAEIDALYHGRKPHKEVHYNDPNGLDISDTVIKYLPIGISFDDAESILRFAGFKVSRKAG
jgi:hypothetical protein